MAIVCAGIENSLKAGTGRILIIFWRTLIQLRITTTILQDIVDSSVLTGKLW